MVDGTPTGTIEKWLNATYELRSFGKARPFSTKEQSTEKTSVLCSQLDCHRGRNGVKGQDERRTTAPLTPSRPLPESFCLRSRKSDLTEADVVIHGLSSAVLTDPAAETQCAGSGETAGEAWGAATPRGKGARFPFGSTALPDLDRPRPWLTGVGCTGTGSTGTCTAEAVPNPPETGATTRGALAAGILAADPW
jgi:hypothetical protein